MILKYNYLFWLFAVVPFKIDFKSFFQSPIYKWDDGEYPEKVIIF